MVVNDSSPNAPKGKGNKQPKDTNQHEKGDESPLQYNIESKSSSREESFIRKRDKCAYCKNLGHDELKCFHKEIDELTHILQKSNI